MHAHAYIAPGCRLARLTIGRAWVEGCRLLLWHFLHLPVQLTGGCLVEPHGVDEATGPDGIQEAQCAHAIHVSRVLGQVEGDLQREAGEGHWARCTQKASRGGQAWRHHAVPQTGTEKSHPQSRTCCLFTFWHRLCHPMPCSPITPAHSTECTWVSPKPLICPPVLGHMGGSHAVASTEKHPAGNSGSSRGGCWTHVEAPFWYVQGRTSLFLHSGSAKLKPC